MIEFCARLLPHANRKVSFKDKAITTGEQVEMARGSGSGSYRQWAAEQRAAERVPVSRLLRRPRQNVGPVNVNEPPPNPPLGMKMRCPRARRSTNAL